MDRLVRVGDAAGPVHKPTAIVAESHTPAVRIGAKVTPPTFELCIFAEYFAELTVCVLFFPVTWTALTVCVLFFPVTWTAAVRRCGQWRLRRHARCFCRLM